MDDGGRSAQIVRFGIFEADLESAELRKNGLKVPLQGQPFQVFAFLLQHSGKLVTREELRQKVWPEDTFVDFDHGLNTAITKIRTALGDSAENPRFVETLPRRGYRFIGPVEKPSAPAPSPSALKGHLETLAGDRKAKSWFWPAAILAVITLAAGIGWLYFHNGSPSVSGATPRMVPFTSSAGFKSTPAFSPDGKELAFAWQSEKDEGTRIYVKLVDAGTPLRLSAGPGDDDSPTWSPDGRFVAFVRHSGDVNGYFIVPSLGGPERKISDRFADLPYWGNLLDWLPDGRSLLVADLSSPQDSRLSLILVSLDTGERRVVLTPLGPYLANAISSPNGNYVAFVQGGGYMAQELYVMRVGTSDASRLTSDNALIQGLAWTPDSKSIVFSSSRAGLQSLWRIPISGGVPVSVVTTGDDAVTPTIPREGAQLAFVLNHGKANIWRVAGPAAKSGPPARFIASSHRDIDASFSPDGKRMCLNPLVPVHTSCGCATAMVQTRCS
jgi:Tol biopolymer transport system component/DNA-binding winged helix-turn-helix (wHTH) protein